MKKIAIIMGSESDLPIAKAAADVLRDAGVPFTLRIMSAHRTPEAVGAFAASAERDGFAAVIAVAGKAAHLAGVIAAGTLLPVIGVPAPSRDLGGLDALLSTVQMPAGVPVATVAIGGGANAAWLALRILALSDGGVRRTLSEKRAAMADAVAKKDAALQERPETEA